MQTDFEDDLGKCERIFKTPIPMAYTRMTSRFLVRFMKCSHCCTLIVHVVMSEVFVTQAHQTLTQVVCFVSLRYEFVGS